MTEATAPDYVSQETSAQEALRNFTSAWIDGVGIAGPGLFGCQASAPSVANHYHQLTPKLDVMRKALPNKSQADAIFAAAMACFYNAAEGEKLLKKAGCESFGHIATVLDRRRRAILATLLINFQGW